MHEITLPCAVAGRQGALIDIKILTVGRTFASRHGEQVCQYAVAPVHSRRHFLAANHHQHTIPVPRALELGDSALALALCTYHVARSRSYTPMGSCQMGSTRRWPCIQRRGHGRGFALVAERKLKKVPWP